MSLLTRTLTFDREHHALADVRADSVAGLAQVVAAVLLQNVTDQQRPVGHELDPARQRNRVVLLRVPCSTGGEQRTVVNWRGKRQQKNLQAKARLCLSQR